MQEFNINATATTNTINLTWENVDGVSWYQTSFGQAAEDKSLSNSFQNPNTEDVSYVLTGLTSDTTYEIFIEGTTQADGGNTVARSRTITVTTSSVITTTPPINPPAEETTAESLKVDGM